MTRISIKVLVRTAGLRYMQSCEDFIMALQVGRNAPCPCGSGKKYKKCCLEMDVALLRSPAVPPAAERPPTQLSHRETRPLSPPPSPSPAERREQSPEEQRWEQRWQDFDKASLDRRLELARELLSSESPMGEELVFDLAEGVVHPARRQGRIADAEAFLDWVAAAHPAAAAAEAHWFGLWRTEHALLRPDGDVLAALLAWLPAAVEHNVEFFEMILERLRFHNRVDEAITAACQAWPLLRWDRCPKFPEHWFVTPAVRLIIDRWLQQRPDSPPDDPELWQALEPFWQELDRQQVADEVRVRAAASPRALGPGAFGKPGPAKKGLYLLSLDFRDALHGRFGWPLARAALATEVLSSALLEHNLSPSPSKKSGAAPRQPSRSAAVLLPDPARMDEYVSELVGFMSLRQYRAAALGLALPLWPLFLAEREFVTHEEANSIAASLRQRLRQLAKVLDHAVYDPALQETLQRTFPSLQEPPEVSMPPVTSASPD